MAGLLRMRLNCNVSTSRQRRDKGTRKVTRSLLLGTCAQSESQSVQQESLAVDFNIDQFYKDVLDPNSGIRQYFVDWPTLRDRLILSGDCYGSVLVSKVGSLFGSLQTNLTDFVSIPFRGSDCLTDGLGLSYANFLMNLQDLCSLGEFLCDTVEEGFCLVRQCVYLKAEELTVYERENSSFDFAFLTRIAKTFWDDYYLSFLNNCYGGGLKEFPQASHLLKKVVCSNATETANSSSVTTGVANLSSVITGIADLSSGTTDIANLSFGTTDIANLSFGTTDIANSTSVTPTSTPSAESDTLANLFIGVYVLGGFAIAAGVYQVASRGGGPWLTNLMSRLGLRSEAPSTISPESLASGEVFPLTEKASQESVSAVPFYVEIHPTQQESPEWAETPH